MAATAMLHVRMDKDLKARGNAALAAIGLSAADAVRLLYHRIVADQAFPLELKVPNATTLEAMAETEALMRSGEPGFADAKAMFRALDGED
ncbi:type II toxin-antitoxin system RelB/DinJ family antitoxin [Brevundimonas subvibrioides]|uniref:type II toxin-antitoxin system RelB/DinJ family antitoxin n=1 Tax=Brevundimonas subvibrioides TaxID=74313 RepID=UPI0022B3B457|nr:type II toxin-antitoxin system RelB/DinJ family antitoxin [Brevundimonas subvibrioides]